MEDHKVFHVYGGESSSENSFGDDEESLQVDKGLIIDQDLLNYARWNPIRQVGKS